MIIIKFGSTSQKELKILFEDKNFKISGIDKTKCEKKINVKKFEFRESWILIFEMINFIDIETSSLHFVKINNKEINIDKINSIFEYSDINEKLWLLIIVEKNYKILISRSINSVINGKYLSKTFFIHSYDYCRTPIKLINYTVGKTCFKVTKDWRIKVTTNPFLKLYNVFQNIKEKRTEEFTSHMLARSVAEIALYEFHSTGDNLFKFIYLKALWYCLDSQLSDGSYNHGEYNKEDQFRLHLEALELLFSSIYLFPEHRDEIKLSIKKSIKYMIKSSFKSKNFVWFPHDTLEVQNKLILNTHLYTIFGMIMTKEIFPQLIENLEDIIKKAINCLDLLLYNKRIIDWQIITLYQFLSLPPLISFITIPFFIFEFIKINRYPGLITKNYFVKRGMHDSGPHYPIINSNDLVRILPYLVDSDKGNIRFKKTMKIIRSAKRVIGGKNLFYFHTDWYYYNEMISNLFSYGIIKKDFLYDFDSEIKNGYNGLTKISLLKNKNLNYPAPAIIQFSKKNVFSYHINTKIIDNKVEWSVLLVNYNNFEINTDVLVMHSGKIIDQGKRILEANSFTKIKYLLNKDILNFIKGVKSVK